MLQRLASAPVWNLGFRPFYLGAGLFAMFALAVWTARYAGWAGGGTYLADPYWHAHEMVFGYALAVITGSLFHVGGTFGNVVIGWLIDRKGIFMIAVGFFIATTSRSVVRRVYRTDVIHSRRSRPSDEMEMLDLKRKGRTVLKSDKLQYNVPLKDDLFTLQALRRGE